MSDTTETWLLRLQALTVAERPALLREMSRGDAEACLLRLVGEPPRMSDWAKGRLRELDDRLCAVEKVAHQPYDFTELVERVEALEGRGR